MHILCRHVDVDHRCVSMQSIYSFRDLCMYPYDCNLQGFLSQSCNLSKPAYPKAALCCVHKLSFTHVRLRTAYSHQSQLTVNLERYDVRFNLICSLCRTNVYQREYYTKKVDLLLIRCCCLRLQGKS